MQILREPIYSMKIIPDFVTIIKLIFALYAGESWARSDRVD